MRELTSNRRPLGYLVADDPGTGKTGKHKWARILINTELIARGDLKRCLIVCPGARSSSGTTSSTILGAAVETQQALNEVEIL
jgi:hypothetical protein